MSVPAPKIITCSQWGAKQPKAKPILVGKPDKGIVHHTDGHAASSGVGTSTAREAAMNYARALQYLHMEQRGWNDSGHNFLVMRGGIILQGRWGTITAIEHGRMVESAHCPGQNGNPGVEHEHLPGEPPTLAQIESSIHLFAWIYDRCHIPPTALYGHRDFYATDCPDTLYPLIQGWRGKIAALINEHGRSGGSKKSTLAAKLAVARELKA